MNETIRVKDILSGYKVDSANIQSVGNMAVLPIVSDTEFTDVADMHEVTLKKDQAYNQLVFGNASGKIGIVFQGWTIMTPQRAQDRTVPYAHIVKAGATKVVPANCIQAHQPGTHDLSQWEQENFMILPASLRGIALKQNTDYNQSDMGSLWDSLSRWASRMNCRESGLTMFYSTYKETLNNFVAEFEPVDRQLGAIVFINGEIVAIDILPKYETWRRVWRTLIRDSYGAEAVRLKEVQGAVEKHPTIDLSKIHSLNDLVTGAVQVKQEFVDALKATFGGVADIGLDYRTLEEIDELTMLKLESADYMGQGLLHGDKHFVYLSLVKTSSRAVPIKRFKSLRDNPYPDNGFSFN